MFGVQNFYLFLLIFINLLNYLSKQYNHMNLDHQQSSLNLKGISISLQIFLSYVCIIKNDYSNFKLND